MCFIFIFFCWDKNWGNDLFGECEKYESLFFSLHLRREGVWERVFAAG